MVLELQVVFTTSSHEALTPVLLTTDRLKLLALPKQFLIHFGQFFMFSFEKVFISAFRKKFHFVLRSGIFQFHNNLVISYSTNIVGPKKLQPYNAWWPKISHAYLNKLQLKVASLLKYM